MAVIPGMTSWAETETKGFDTNGTIYETYIA